MDRYEKYFFPGNPAAPRPADRRSGDFRAYVPKMLRDQSVDLPRDLIADLAGLERRISTLGTDNSLMTSYDVLFRMLMRSEAVASSHIEGLRAAPGKVIAALRPGGNDHDGRGEAAAIARNIRALDAALTRATAAEAITPHDLEKLQATLITEDEKRGIRTSQNWVGGSPWHPFDAEFVPPPPGELPALLDDLCQEASASCYSPLIQAARVHAQFETLHPFPDGNGRIGRALIPMILTRRGLRAASVVPISAGLLTRADDYTAALQAWRYEPDGCERWLRVFQAAVEGALAIVGRMRADLADIIDDWEKRHENWVRTQDRARGLRSDSAAVKLRHTLPKLTMFTTSDVAVTLAVSTKTAERACKELEAVGIITACSLGKGVRGWKQPALLELVRGYERHLGSTQWDTVVSPPRRAVPVTTRRDAT